MFLKISLFIIILKFSKAINCNELKIQQNEYFQSARKESLIIQTNEADISKIHSIGYDILSLQNSMQYILNGTLISSLLLQSFQYQYEKQICNLIVQENMYFIQCINGLTFNEDQKILIYSDKISILTQFNDVCEQIFYNNKFTFTIICYSQDYFKLLFLDLKEKTQLNSYYNHQKDHEPKYCTKITIQNEPFSYIIGFVNCSDWVIYRSYNSEITLILNQSILRANQTFNDLINLVNLQKCQQSIYALFDNAYILIKDFEILDLIFIKLIKKIQLSQLVFDNACKINIFIGQDESIIPFQYNHQDQTLSFSKLKYPLKVHQINSFTIFQFDQNIQLFINLKFIQYYDISGLILFSSEINFMITIDPILKLINLFKVKSLSKYVIPKYQYIYEYSKKSFYCCQLQNIGCYKIIQRNSSSQFLETKFSFWENKFFECSPQIKLHISYYELIVGIPIYLEVPREYQNILSIDSIKKNFSEICLYQKKILNDSVLLLYDDLNGLSIFSNQNYIQFYNCISRTLLHQEKIQDKSVYVFQNQLIIVDKGKTKVNIINVNNTQWTKQNLNFDSEILDVYQAQETMIINLKEKAVLIFYVSIHNEKQYLNVTLNKDILLYYFDNFFIKIYQYQGYILVQNLKEVIKINFLDNLILYINQALTFIVLQLNVQFLSINQTQNRLKIFALEKNELVYLQDLDLFDYSIYKPLKYKAILSDFLIVAQRYNKLYLLIYSQKLNHYKIKQIIQISQPNFLIDNNQIYYFDENNILTYQDKKQITITYQLQDFNKIVQQREFHLNLISQFNRTQQNKFNIQIKIQNQCNKVYSKSNLSIYQYSDEKNSLTLSNYFSGPIEIVFLNDECLFNLSGPFQFRSRIYSCDQNNDQICLQTNTLANINVLIKFKLLYYFIKIRENNGVPNKPKLFLIQRNKFLMQLTNGDLLIIQQFSDQTVGQILKYDFLSDQFIQFQTFSFPLKNEIISEINIVANILLTQTSLQFYIFCINEDFIRQIYQSKIKINVAFIQNTLEEYLIQSEDTEFFIMKHCYLNQNEISFINTYHLSKAKILQSFQELTSIYFNVELQNNLQIKINNSAKNNIYITINCIFSYQNFLFYVKVQLNTVQTTYELNIQKILRHYERIENFFHINEYLAIISNYQNQYIYDLKQEQYFYDPIYQMVTNQIILQDYNNTHFFLFNLTENKAYIVEIGYEINIQSKKKSQDCLLIARNEISQAEINVFIQQEELSFKQQYDRGIIILLIIIITITILLIFIFRRNKLKQHKLQSFKLNISMDQSRQ